MFNITITLFRDDKRLIITNHVKIFPFLFYSFHVISVSRNNIIISCNNEKIILQKLENVYI